MNTKARRTASAPPKTANTAPQAALTRRGFFSAGLKAGLGLGLSALAPACAPAARPRGSAPVQLVYQDWRTSWFPRMAQDMLAVFQQQNPNIHVFYNLDPPSEIFNEKMIADFQSGTAPDVFQGCCGYFPAWAQNGYTLDLRPFIKDLDKETIADWDPAQYQAFFSRDGALFGLPKYHGALAVYYNKDLFDHYGVEYPADDWTYTDYLAAMKAFKPDPGESERPWGSMLDIAWDRLQVHVNGWGGHFVDPRAPARSQLGSLPARQALEWLRARMLDERVMATPLDMQKLSLPEAFLTGRLAMIEDGSWSLKTILSGAAFRLGVAPFPAGPQQRVTLASTDGFGIYAGTRNPEAAWELLKFLISKEYGRQMAKIHYLQPARASLVDEWIGFMQADYPFRARDMNLAAFADGHRKRYSVVAEVFANQEDAQRIAREAWDKILVLGQAPVESLVATSQQIEEAQAAVPVTPAPPQGGHK
jgi:multiple sugar transport system substrate-binding protein